MGIRELEIRGVFRGRNGNSIRNGFPVAASTIRESVTTLCGFLGSEDGRLVQKSLRQNQSAVLFDPSHPLRFHERDYAIGVYGGGLGFFRHNEDPLQDSQRPRVLLIKKISTDEVVAFALRAGISLRGAIPYIKSQIVHLNPQNVQTETLN